MKNIIKVAILISALFAGIQTAYACWFEDPENPSLQTFDDPPQKIIPGISTTQTETDPETGATITTTTWDEGTYKYTCVVTQLTDPVTGIETTSFDWVFEEYVAYNPPTVLAPYLETRTLNEDYVYNPDTGNTTRNITENSTRRYKRALADGSSIDWTTTIIDRSTLEVFEGLRLDYIGGGVPPSDRIVGWERIESTSQTVTEAITQTIDPETGMPMIDSNTGELITTSDYSAPVTVVTTVEREFVNSKDPGGTVISYGTETTTTETTIDPVAGTSVTIEKVTETVSTDVEGNVTETVTVTVTETSNPETGVTTTITETETRDGDGNVTETGTVTVSVCSVCGATGNWTVCPNANLTCPVCDENIHGEFDHECAGVPEDPTVEDPGEDPPEPGDPDPTPIPEVARFYFSRLNQQAITKPVGTTYTVNLPMSVYAASTTGSAPGNITIYLHCVPDEVTSGATYIPAVTSATLKSFTPPAPPLQLFGRSLYPNMTSSKGDDTWHSNDEFLLILSTDPDTADALIEVDNCCDGAGCRYHLRVKFSETTKPGR